MVVRHSTWQLETLYAALQHSHTELDTLQSKLALLSMPNGHDPAARRGRGRSAHEPTFTLSVAPGGGRPAE